ncbi:MAG: type II toxin-antitoxin system VapC family toxin [Rubrobacteraceae bacterium]
MRLVLDTHTLLWYVADDPKLSRRAAELLENIENDALVSVGSLMEISIKISTGKLSIGSPISRFVTEKVEAIGIEILPITPPHLDVLSNLPSHHRDPFDRHVVVAQCVSEDISLLSRDEVLDRYGVERLW